MKKITVLYRLTRSKTNKVAGFASSITVDAFSGDSAIEKAKKAVSEVYGSAMVKRFKFELEK